MSILQNYLEDYSKLDSPSLVYNPVTKRKDVKVKTAIKSIQKAIENKSTIEKDKSLDMMERKVHKDNIKKFSGIILRIVERIFSRLKRSTDIWTEYKSLIINELQKIDLYKEIDNYIPCDRKLYLTRPYLRTHLRDSIHCGNDQFFTETGHCEYEPKDYNLISRDNFYNFIRDCVNIIAKKQQCK